MHLLRCQSSRPRNPRKPWAEDVAVEGVAEAALPVHVDEVEEAVLVVAASSRLIRCLVALSSVMSKSSDLQVRH